MARKPKRPYGSGCLLSEGKNLAIRWRETIIGTDGKLKKVLRYQSLGPISKKEAGRILGERLASLQQSPARQRTFGNMAEAWKNNVLALLKYTTQRMHRHILEKHLLPRFGHLD